MSTATPQHGNDSGVRSILANALQSSLHRIRTTINRILPPERQANLKQALVAFATSHPLLATLLLSQVAFSAIPLILFIVLTIGIFVFSLAATLVLGLLGALMATLFCMALGSIILIPTLFLTTFVAGGVWLWAWGIYYIVQWVGTGDTALLTRLSLLLMPQKTWARQYSEQQGQEQGQEQPTGSEPRQEEVQRTDTDQQASMESMEFMESDGYPEKQANGWHEAES